MDTGSHYLQQELYSLVRQDDEIFDFLQNNLFDGLWYWDLECPEHEWMNARFWETLGYNPTDMPHTPSAWQDIINEEDLALATDNFNKHIQNPNHPYDQIVRYEHKNGDTVWIRCYGKAIRNADGLAVRMLGAHQNVSYQQKNNELIDAMNKLCRKEREFDKVQSIAQLGSWYLDLSTNKVEWTDELYRMYGFDSKLPPPPYTEHQKLFAPASWELLSTSLDRTRQEGIPYELELQTIRKDGSNGWMWVRGEAIRSSDNAIVGLWGAAQDITKKKATESELLKAIGLAKESEHSLKEKNEEYEALNEDLRQANEELNDINAKLFEREIQLKEKNEEYESLNEDLRQTNEELNDSNLRLRESEKVLKEKNEEYEALNEELRQTNEELSEINMKVRESESRLKDILDNLFEGYQILDFDWTYRYINKAAEMHNQRPKEELMGKRYVDCWPGIEKTKVFGLIQDCLENRNLHRFENQFVYPNGDMGWFDIGIQPIKEGVFILSNNITEKKLAEQRVHSEKSKLEFSETQLKKAQKTAKVGSWTWYIAEDKLWWSDEMYSIFGVDKALFSGNLADIINETIHPDDREKVNQSNESVINQKEPYPLEYRIITKDGDLKYVYALADKVELDENGQSIRLSGIVKDITDYKNIQIELEAAKNRAEDSNRLKSAFLANMSHEIRTPLNAILGFAGFLKDPQKSRIEQQRYAEIIMNSGKHLLNVINNIIDLSKIDSGQAKVENTSVNITSVLKDLSSFFHSYLLSKNKYGVHLKLSYPVDNLIAFTDETKLRQVLINLIGNAVKFTEIGVVEFGFSIWGSKLKFFVKDSGIGIPKEKRESIFDRFHQAYDESGKIYGGTGLGLSIAKACVELLNGEIWFESVEQKGTQFFFTVDFVPNVDNDSVQEQRDGVNGEQAYNNELVLVAEDDDLNYEYLELVLKERGLRVVRTSTGKETINMALENDDIRLILMDIQMPEGSGTMAAQKLKVEKPNLPIIAQTAYAFESERRKFLKMGCDGYIAKPINNDILFSVISKALYAEKN